MITVKWESVFKRMNVLTPAERAEKRILEGCGAYCYRVARNSIKTGAPHERSLPGAPPLGHNGRLQYKAFIRFAYDRLTHAVYIGPIPIAGGMLSSPSIIEFGGGELVMVGRGKSRRWVSIDFQPRPHMRPALEKTIEKKLPELLKNSIVPL